MPAAICATPIKGSMLRLVKVDVCGVPVTGTNSIVIVTKGFVQIQQSPQYEDGQEFFERTADGTPCVNQKDDPVLKRLQLQVQMCEIDPVGAALVSSARVLSAESPTLTGVGFAVSEGVPSNRFDMEVWQQVAGSSACDASGLQRYIYNAWPNVGAVQLQDYTIENGRSTLSWQGETRAAAAQWGRGPGTGTKWMPNHATAGALATLDHWGWAITTTPPPTAACGSSTLT